MNGGISVRLQRTDIGDKFVDVTYIAPEIDTLDKAFAFTKDLFKSTDLRMTKYCMDTAESIIEDDPYVTCTSPNDIDDVIEKWGVNFIGLHSIF